MCLRKSSGNTFSFKPAVLSSVSLNANGSPSTGAAVARSVAFPVAVEIDNGRLKMQDLLAGLDTVAVAVPDDWDEMVNLNRPDGR